jgi:hypothetical protein
MLSRQRLVLPSRPMHSPLLPPHCSKPDSSLMQPARQRAGARLSPARSPRTWWGQGVDVSRLRALRCQAGASPAGVTHGGGGATDLTPTLLPGGGDRALLLLPAGGGRLAGGGGRLAGGGGRWLVDAALDSVTAGAALSTTTILIAALRMAGSSPLLLAWLSPDAAGADAAPFPLGLAATARRDESWRQGQAEAAGRMRAGGHRGGRPRPAQQGPAGC